MDEWLDYLPALKRIVEDCQDISSRIRAARALAHATSLLRDRAFAHEMLDAVSRIDASEVDDEAKGHLGLATAMLIFQAGDMDACYDFANAMLKDLRGRGLANSTVIQLQEGLGAARGRQGRYAESAEQHERALSLAHLLGNEHLSASISANLSFCYGRLGRYEEQLLCAQSSPASRPESGVTFGDAQLASSIAFANAALGRLDCMRDAIERFDRRLGPQSDRSAAQAWQLWKADVLAIGGFPDLAFRTALQAINGYGMQLQCSALAGVFARWVALTCEASQAKRLLDHLYENLCDYDALDQLEILYGRLHCRVGDSLGLRQQIEARVRDLPDQALLPLRASGIQLMPPEPSIDLRTAN
jgi:tetratricopeptide (TPR) repeat protein